MPIRNFFSGSDSERENTGGNRNPQEQDDSFAGMQKLDFDFSDEAGDGADDAVSFDTLFDELPQQPAHSAQPAPGPVKAAPFVLDEPGAAERRAAAAQSAEQPQTSAAAQPSPELRPAEPIRPAAAQPAEPVRPAAAQPAEQPQTSAAAQRPAQPSPARRGGQPSFDLSALEKEIDRRPQTSQPEELEGYAPLALDFDLGEEPPRPAAPAATPFVTEPPRPAAPAAETARRSAAPEQAAAPRPAASAAAPFVTEPPRFAAPPAPRPAAPAAAPTPAARRPAAPADGLAPGQGAAQRPASRSADYSTMSFSLGDVSVEAPTMAFMPIEQINSAASAQAEANRRAAEKKAPAASPAPSADARAARMAKERNIGAAVFSALMEQDAPSAPAARTASPGAARAPAATMEWPSAPRSSGDGSRTPKPINWRTQTGAGAAGGASAQPSPREEPQPEPAPAPTPQPAASDDGFTPLDFNFNDINFDENDPLASPGGETPRTARRGADFLDLYEPDPDKRPPRRPRSGRDGGSGGGRPPRRPSGQDKGRASAKTIFAWCGILLVAVLVILLFVVFGEKDGDSSSGSSGPASVSTSDAPPSESLPAEPVVAPIPRDEWYMVLANRNSVLSADFAVEQTATVGEALVDARIADALRQMVNDAAAAGIRLKPTNGYRTVARQQELWDARVKKLMTENGMTQADAEVRALDFTSRAGTSDHNTGLGLDIVSEDHPAKDAAYADTAAAAWLQEHAAEYGFILRYPSDKTAVTGMDFEPWHYRYVGTEQAQLIQASGLCLEEYLAQ